MPRVLIVEDETLLRLVTSDAFEEAGFQVHGAVNSMEAIEILRLENEIDIVLTDVRMRGELDGLGLLGWIRRHRPKLPVIVTSAYSLNTEVILHPEKGERFIPKPFDPFAIAEEIKASLGQKRQE